MKITRRIPLAFAVLASATLPSIIAAEPPRSWPPDQFQPITAERIAALPATEQPAWKAYFDESQALAARLPVARRADQSSLIPVNGPPVGGTFSRGLNLNAPDAWFASDEARAIADHIVEHQSVAGAWTKGNDYSRSPDPAAAKPNAYNAGTFDNNSTTTEMRMLARITAAATDAQRAAPWRESFGRALEYCLVSQYPNGGWPQIYPLVGGYHDAITYNDDAMAHVLEILRDVADGRNEFAFVADAKRRECAHAFDRGIACMLATQLKSPDGKLTGWCQQYDALTMQPCAARNFEPIATTANETAYLTSLLMRLPKPQPEVVASVEAAVAWMQRTALHDVAWSRRDPTGALQPKPGAPLLWSRLYEPGTDKPIFGDRDRTIHYAVEELSSERRAGYAWFGTWPGEPLAEYQTWSGRAR